MEVAANRVTKIAVVGNGGGGKSTATRELSDMFGLPFYSVDKVQFASGWQRVDLDIVAAWHADILKTDRWIIDGWGSWDLIDGRFAACEAILLIDFPLEVHLEWAKRRSALSKQGIQPDAPPGCDYHAIDELMEETLRRVDRDLLPILREKVEVASRTKVVEVISNPAKWHTGLDRLIVRCAMSTL